MKTVSATLAIVGFVIGLMASWYWLKSSQITTVPVWGEREPLDQTFANAGLIAGVLQANAESGRLNMIAAKLTAAAVLLSTGGSLASLCV
jgi:hypothetical protein